MREFFVWIVFFLLDGEIHAVFKPRPLYFLALLGYLLLFLLHYIFLLLLSWVSQSPWSNSLVSLDTCE